MPISGILYTICVSTHNDNSKFILYIMRKKRANFEIPKIRNLGENSSKMALLKVISSAKVLLKLRHPSPKRY